MESPRPAQVRAHPSASPWRVLVLGSDGMLGRALFGTAPVGASLVARSHRTCDITDREALAAVVREVAPGCIVNAAAYTDVDAAEREVERAHHVNAWAVGELGRIALAARARVVHFSTDYVFDGVSGAPYGEDARCHPLNAYGASKLAGERALMESGCHALIIRTQWLFGSSERTFPAVMAERARARLATRVVNDQRGRPTYAPDLAEAVWRVVTQGVTGMLHITNTGEATRFEVAQRIFARAGQTALLSPCESRERPGAVRPLDARLDTTRFATLLGEPLPHWTDALSRFLDDREAASVVGSPDAPARVEGH